MGRWMVPVTRACFDRRMTSEYHHHPGKIHQPIVYAVRIVVDRSFSAARLV